MVVHAFNHSTQKAAVGFSESEVSVVYKESFRTHRELLHRKKPVSKSKQTKRM